MTMPGTPTRTDRRALRRYLARFSWATQDFLGSPLRRIRADLRRDTLAAADDVGMDQALADLGDPDALAERYTEEHGRRGPRGARRAVRLAAAAVAVAAVVTAGVLVRQLPRVETTGAFGTDPAFVLTAEVGGVTWVATDIGEGSVEVELGVRNPGPFTETITGVDTVASRVGLVPAPADSGIDEAVQAAVPSRSLTVPAHGMAVVRVTLSYPCAPLSAGVGSGVDEARLTVRTLGIEREVRLPLRATYVVTTTQGWEPPAGCVPGGPR